MDSVRRFPKPTMFAAAVALIAPLCASNVSAAEFALAASAIDKALLKQAFTRSETLPITGQPGDCTYAYLEWPRSSLAAGRLVIRVHFSGRAGIKIGDSCHSAGDAFWMSVSGRPFLKGDFLAIDDVRVDDARPEYQALLTRLVAEQLPSALSLNLRDELMKLLRSGDTGYSLTLPRLLIQGVEAEANVLRLRFDFTLEAR